MLLLKVIVLQLLGSICTDAFPLSQPGTGTVAGYGRSDDGLYKRPDGAVIGISGINGGGSKKKARNAVAQPEAEAGNGIGHSEAKREAEATDGTAPGLAAIVGSGHKKRIGEVANKREAHVELGTDATAIEYGLIAVRSDSNLRRAAKATDGTAIGLAAIVGSGHKKRVGEPVNRDEVGTDANASILYASAPVTSSSKREAEANDGSAVGLAGIQGSGHKKRVGESTKRKADARLGTDATISVVDAREAEAVGVAGIQGTGNAKRMNEAVKKRDASDGTALGYSRKRDPDAEAGNGVIHTTEGELP